MPLDFEKYRTIIESTIRVRKRSLKSDYLRAFFYIFILNKNQAITYNYLQQDILVIMFISIFNNPTIISSILNNFLVSR